MENGRLLVGEEEGCARYGTHGWTKGGAAPAEHARAAVIRLGQAQAKVQQTLPKINVCAWLISSFLARDSSSIVQTTLHRRPDVWPTIACCTCGRGPRHVVRYVWRRRCDSCTAVLYSTVLRTKTATRVPCSGHRIRRPAEA